LCRANGETSSISKKDRTILYHRKRLEKFRKLLAKYPDSRGTIIDEARIDIPTPLRADIWAALLGVPSEAEYKKIYDSIDKRTIGPADHQIALDVIR